jgi:CheY-like chemotaxis protein
LTRLGFDARIANNGLEALDLIKQAPLPFDIVFMDIQMPVMSGWEASALIKDLKLQPPPVVIAATAATTVSDRDKSLQSMDEYISKPISMQNLRDTLERAWSKTGRAPLKLAQIGIPLTGRKPEQPAAYTTPSDFLNASTSSLPTAAAVSTLSKDPILKHFGAHPKALTNVIFALSGVIAFLVALLSIVVLRT